MKFMLVTENVWVDIEKVVRASVADKYLVLEYADQTKDSMLIDSAEARSIKAALNIK